MSRFSIPLLLGWSIAALTCQPTLAQDPWPIASIQRARITADGDVAGRRTDFLINLDVPRDNSPGFTLPAGDRIEIIIPPEFVNDLTVTNFNTGVTAPVTTETVFGSNACAIGNFFCNTSVFVQGWPQRPILTVLPPANPGSPDDFMYDSEVYTLSQGDTGNVFVHTAVVDVGPGNAPPGPGIKQIHMILPGFSNPTVIEPTDFPITIRQTRLNGNDVQVIREGTAPLTIIPEVEPSINLTSVFDPMRRNTVYQEVMPGEAPLPYEFYMWDGDGGAYEGLTINGPDVLDAAQNVVGRVSISAPDGASGQSLATDNPSSDIPGGDIFFHLPTARLTAQFTPGDMPGDYVTTIEMFKESDIGMNQPQIVSFETLTVRVVPEPVSGTLLGMGIAVLGLLRRRS